MLEIIDVTKRFGEKVAVQPLSLNVQKGEFLSILGPSGCGKTTLLRLLGGLEKPDSGTLRLDGQDITQLAAHKRSVHTVFQRYALFPHMSVFDNVAFGLRCQKVGEAEISSRVQQMLEMVNLKGQGARQVPTLSGGEQQRVALVRALINTPKILLLDEPLGALDLKLRLQLQQELVAIQKRVQTTFIYVTHDQQEALNMSDRVVVMNQGVVEQVGSPNEIYESPKTLFVAAFVGGINRLEGVLGQDESGRKQVVVEGIGNFWVNSEAANGTANGGAVTLCVRPEKLAAFARRPSSCENVLEGIVKAQTYLGTHTQIEVTLKNGNQMSVFQQNSERLLRKTFQLNDKIYLGWQAALGHLYWR